MTQPKLRVAAAQYRLQRMSRWNDYQVKLRDWVGEAAAAGAELLVFPEYGGLELLSLVDRRILPDRRSPSRHTMGPLPPPRPDRRNGPNLRWEAEALQKLLPDYRLLHAELAEQWGVYLLAGSVPVVLGDGTIRNTAYFFTPKGTMGSQDKIVMTRWEREAWGISGGEEIRVFETRFGRLGVTICYDVEFPLIARSQAEAGARIVLAPCCADSLRGYHRVRIGARARALENQIYVVQAPTVGAIDGIGALTTSTGAAGAFAPPDLGRQATGVIEQGPMDLPQWVYADLDLCALERIRSRGRPANELDWAEHARAGRAVEGRLDALL